MPFYREGLFCLRRRRRFFQKKKIFFIATSASFSFFFLSSKMYAFFAFFFLTKRVCNGSLLFCVFHPLFSSAEMRVVFLMCNLTDVSCREWLSRCYCPSTWQCIGRGLFYTLSIVIRLDFFQFLKIFIRMIMQL